MDREVTRDIDLHAVRRIAEVRAPAANDLLEDGWILHDIYFSTDGDYRSNYILLTTVDPICPSCGALAKLEVLDQGERVRYVCTRECAYPGLESEQPALT
jgi:hypothetical protein